mmetsp:Transcript_16701/g.46739  ORF Transcript_16701/g.46739 Transcript_16701/m.46739 type:complete len:468 (-) Transcript_16701:340-1743(-)|eukprot:CAMPEP_0119546976 /NCGR_PEP_ID=MMETSP1352-20130426/1199_1 /TAXON_ID=265584 /ORGANISM="Stauroneis constricta, Strain CCMP1120" /LENGTH=467 /DNA_ID=CAMNT_0007591765 /DNA_START=188 /DNA_END=1591 /DNA_ORIENTATION=-
MAKQRKQKVTTKKSHTNKRRKQRADDGMMYRIGMALLIGMTGMNFMLGIILLHSSSDDASSSILNIRAFNSSSFLLHQRESLEAELRRRYPLEVLDPYLYDQLVSGNGFCTDEPCNRNVSEIDWLMLRFPDTKQRDLVSKSHSFKIVTDEIQFYGSTDPARLHAELLNIKNGTYRNDIDCGYRASHEDLVPFADPAALTMKVDGKLLPLHMVPESYSFQHFADGSLPKIMMHLDAIRKHNITVALQSPRDQIVNEMLSRLNISTKFMSPNRQTGFLGADELYSGCIAPPLHPLLWRRARVLITKKAPVPNPDGPIILIHRLKQNSKNGGRMIENYDELKAALEDKYGERLVEYDSNQSNPVSSIELFSNASAVVGTHGGAFANLLFAPIGTVVIEAVPCKPNGDPFGPFPSFLFYEYASMLGHTYWRMQYVSRNHDAIMDPETVLQILEDPLAPNSTANISGAVHTS